MRKTRLKENVAETLIPRFLFRIIFIRFPQLKKSFAYQLARHVQLSCEEFPVSTSYFLLFIEILKNYIILLKNFQIVGNAILLSAFLTFPSVTLINYLWVAKYF